MIPAELRQPGARVSLAASAAENQANERRLGVIVAPDDERLLPWECFGCGRRLASLEQGASTQCPACGSYELHDPTSPQASRPAPGECLVRWDDDGSVYALDLAGPGWSLVAGPEFDGGPFEGADYVSIYTRAQAIEDGDLVDCSELAREAGFTIPVALTRAAWSECVEWTRSGLQDEKGRLWDVLSMAVLAGRGKGGSELSFEVLRVPNEASARNASLVQLTMTCGPGDDPAPVITISLQGESL